MSEFALIAKLHSALAVSHPEVQIKSGDDAAVIVGDDKHALAISCDTLISGRHFPRNTSAHAMAFKALAVNLSDMAAMGAVPRYATLALSLPKACANNDFISEFAQGFAMLANQYGVELIGGDTTASSQLCINITIIGKLPIISGSVEALRRSGAELGDDIFVSRELGAAGFILAQLEKRLPNHIEPIKIEKYNALDYPQPEVILGQKLRAIANSAIDISDGLLADLQHILSASGFGAVIDIANLPLAAMLKSPILREELNWAQQLALTTGDHYGLCFTAPRQNRESILALGAWRIGTITQEQGIRLVQNDVTLSLPISCGFNHFA